MTREREMRRVCFTLQVKPDRLAEYRERHAAVWADMLEALAATGWRNYSLFLRPDGLLVGYLECVDFESSQQALVDMAASSRWEESMRDFFLQTSGEEKRPLDEVFHLEDQLTRMSTETPDRRMGEAR